MAEWHVTPDYIASNWTEELLELMVSKLVERKQRETIALHGNGDNSETVTDGAIFERAPHLIKRGKKPERR